MLLNKAIRMKMTEEKRKKELSSEFNTLNNKQKDYILNLTRTLANFVKKWPWISTSPENRDKREIND